MTEKETMDYCIGSYRNFLKSFVDQFEDPDDKIQFEMCTTIAMIYRKDAPDEITRFSNILTTSILHYGDKLLNELRKVFEEIVPEERRMSWN